MADKSAVAKKNGGKLSLFSLAAIGIGTTIGAGVVTVTGQAVGVTGRSAWLAYLIAIIWGAVTILPHMFMVSTFRITGGNYSCVAGVLGPRVGGIFSCMTIPMGLNWATFCVGFAQYVQSLYPAANNKLTAIIILIVFYALNLMGINAFVKVQNVLTICLIGALLFFSASGLAMGISAESFAFGTQAFAPNGFDGIIQAVTLFIFSTVAYGTLTNYSHLTAHPKKDPLKGMLITILAICIVYPLVALVAGGCIPVEEAANQPLTVIANYLWSRPLVIAFVVFGPLAALVTTLNGNISGYGIPLLGAAKDGWFPDFMAKQNKSGAPYVFQTLGFLIALVPILMDYNISSIIRNMVIVFNVNNFFMFLAAFFMPKKFPEAWKKSTMHIPTSLYYVLMTLAGILVIASIGLQLRNLSAFIIIFTVGLYALVFLYGTYRYKKGYVHFERKASLEEDCD